MTVSPASWVGLDLDDGRYHVSAALGEGGMAYIYRALDRKKNRDVVLKVPKPALLADPEFVHRFVREVKTLVELRHPAIVPVLGFGRHQGMPFAVLEYMPGGTLDDREKPCRPGELTGWLRDVGAALDHIHANGYVHRDVKPSNILFDAQGRARLSDFGVVKAVDEKAGQTRALTETGVAIGTPEYMAPELARGESYDGKVDQYALAVTVYELLAGRRPIDGGSGPVILVKQIQEYPIPLDEIDSSIPKHLAAAVGRGLAKDSRKRFATCVEFADVVVSAVADQAIAALHAPARSNQPTSRGLTRWRIPLLAASALLVVGIASWFVIQSLKPTPAADHQQTNRSKDAEAKHPPTPAKNFTMSATSTSAFVGKTDSVIVRIERIGSWSGPIEVQLLQPPTDCNFQRLSTTIAPDTSECQFPFTARRQVPDTDIKVAASAEDSISQEATVKVSARLPSFVITPLESMDLVAGESRFVSVFLNREGFDDPIDLILRVPPGVRAEPTSLRFESGTNEASVKLTATAPSKANNAVRLMYNGLEKARFDVRVVASSITPAPPKRSGKTNDGVGQLVTREAGSITVLAFHPKDATVLAIWSERGWVNLWDLESKTRRGGQHLTSAGTRGTFSADGRQVVTCGSNLVHLMNSRGETVNQGPTSYRILGVYFEGQLPNFWTSSGVCNYLGKLIRPGSPGSGVTKIKYGTAGATHSVRDIDGKLQWRSASTTHTWDPQGPMDDFAISNDGRWVAIAANGKVWVQDANQPNGAPIWSKEFATVSAIAIAPNGQQLAIGLNNGEVRLVTIEPGQ